MKTIHTPGRLLAMRPPRPLLFLLPLFLLALPSALNAQLTKIFVASTGNDASDGSRGAPKRNFQAAHDAVAAGGQIVVLDTAGYGILNITKSISVTVPPGVNGFITASGTRGINIDAGAGDTIALRGLIIEGSGNLQGIAALRLGSLAIEDCTVRNFSTGIAIVPFNPLQLYVRNTVVRGCFGGLVVQPNANVAVSAIVTDCQFDQITDTAVAAGNGVGSVDMTLGDCVLSGNNRGVSSFGTSATVRLDNCAVTSNGTGTESFSSGVLRSRVNNTIENNTNNNAAPPSYSAK
jgi:hypothetical protein